MPEGLVNIIANVRLSAIKAALKESLFKGEDLDTTAARVLAALGAGGELHPSIKRPLYHVENLDPTGKYGQDNTGQILVNDPAKADLIGSHLGGNLHAPVFDLDYDAELRPSKTPGHYHLFLEKVIPWNAYQVVLEIMGSAGLIEASYAKACKDRQEGYVRTPHTEK